MSLTQRVTGIFIDPRPTFHKLAEKPLWVDALIVLLIAWIAYSYLIAPFSQRDTLNLMKDNARLKEVMGEERYNARIRELENPSPASVLLNTLVISPALLLLGFLIGSLFLLIFGRLTSTHGSYRQVFASLLHANLIDKILGNAVRLVIILMKKSVFQTSTSLVLLFPHLSFTSPTYVILSQVDLFQLWVFGVLSYGLAATFQISPRKALFISYGFWLLKSALYVTMGLINLRFVR